MANYWMVPRPKRKLISLPESFSLFMAASLNKEWTGHRGKHLDFEDTLEKHNLKRKGDRRDQKGGGGRTYGAWFFSLGLYFKKNKVAKTTLAGEALLNDESPIEVLKHQIIKFQYPSPYSIVPIVNVDERFKIRPFMFLLKLLIHNDIEYLTKEEIAKLILTEADNESDECFDYIVGRILDFRTQGDSILPTNFTERYCSRNGEQSFEKTVSMLTDIADTVMNWLEYTQLAARSTQGIAAIPEKIIEINQIIKSSPKLLTNWDDEENFQRKYGVVPWRKKDTRNLNNSETVTPKMIAKRIVRSKFLNIASSSPIIEVNDQLIEEIYQFTGINHSVISEELSNYSNGALDSFEASYFDMSLKGRDSATEFEKATVELFNNVFNYSATHVGAKPKHPDIFISSEAYSGIIDNKAYASYTISNDHKNRMVYNYVLPYKQEYHDLEFFMYIANGFGKNIDNQIKSVYADCGVKGCAISVNNIIALARVYKEKKLTHQDLRKLFTLNREIKRSDFI